MGSSRHIPSRIAAFALALGLATSAVGGVTPARAGSPTTPSTPTPVGAATAAAGWVAVQVGTDGTLGAGSLADAIFTFAAAGVGGTAAADAVTKLAAKTDAYAGYGGTLKPGEIAKILLAVHVAGGNPNAFAGHDLEADLRGLLVTSGPDTGHFTGATVYGQAVAILALATTTGGVPAGTAAWLAAPKCADGSYPFDIGWCDPTNFDVDTTAMVLQAFLAAGDAADAGTATASLTALQAPDGSFSSYGTNTSTTAAAAQALRAAGETAAADAAAAWLVGKQYGCDAVVADQGAFPFSDSYAGVLIYSATQAVLGLGAPRLDLLSLEGATADAPVLFCATLPAPSLPTVPPTDAIHVGAPQQPASGGLLVFVATLAALVGVLAMSRRAEPRR